MALSKFNYNSFDVTPVASKAIGFNSDADGLTSVSATSMVLIKSQTASSSADISFVHGTSDVVLDSTYPIYLFKYINVHPSVNGTTLQFNGSDDTSSHSYDITKTTNYFQAYHNEGGTDTTLGYSTGNDLAQGTGFQILHQIGSDNDQAGCGKLWLFSPSSTTFVKHFMIDAQTADPDNYSVRACVAGYFNTTAAITAIQFKTASGNIDAGTFKLYGIKDS